MRGDFGSFSRPTEGNVIARVSLVMSEKLHDIDLIWHMQYTC